MKMPKRVLCPCCNGTTDVADFTGDWMEHVHAVDLHAQRTILLLQQIDIRLAEDHEQITLAGVLQILRHVQVGVHAGLEDGNATELVKLGRMGIEVEGAGNQRIEARLARSELQTNPSAGGR